MVVRLLLLLALLGLVIAWVGRRRRSDRSQGVPPAAGSPPSTTPSSPQAMFRCAHCGVHVPLDQAWLGEPDAPGGALQFCSEAHRRMGPSPRGPEAP